MKTKGICILVALVFVVMGGNASVCLGQSIETHYFKAKLSPDNEVPAITDVNASGSARVKITVNRNLAGGITSGTATFELAYQFPTAITLVGFHIHSAPVGVSGPVVIGSGLNATPDATGAGTLALPAVTLDTPDQIAALNGLLTTPQLYYINLHTSDNPAGVIRGQVTTETLFYRATLLPENEVPALPGLNASASVLITLDVTRDSSGNITSGAIMFDANYQFAPAPVTLVGFHIHQGLPGVNAPIVISSNLTAFTDSTGTGKVTRILSLPTDSATLATLKAIVADPGGFYVNMHTSVHPGGAIRGQLTDANQLTTIPYSIDNETFRSNLGIQNLTNLPGRVLVKLYEADGEAYEQSVYVPARGFVQVNRINPTLGNDTPEGAIRLQADQHVEAFVSIIENTNDFPSVVPLAPQGVDLTIASTTNLDRFKSSLVVFNQGSETANVEIISRDISGTVKGQKAITIDAHGFYSDQDILTTLGLSDAYGPLEVRSTNKQPLSAISRVYTVSDNRGSVFAGKEF
jgi:CHRD domain